ncbi:hypothetical protein MRX96_016570 [Rhipicephalus microplus]
MPDRVDVSWTRSELAQTRQRSRQEAPVSRSTRQPGEIRAGVRSQTVCCCEDFGLPRRLQARGARGFFSRSTKWP